MIFRLLFDEFLFLKEVSFLYLPGYVYSKDELLSL